MWNDIVNSFSNLTPMLWVSQICGLIGLIIIGISYLFKKKTFLLIATFSFVFFVLEQVFAGLWSNLIVSSICLFRNAIMVLVLWKRNKELPAWFMFILLGIMWTLEIVYMGVTHTYAVWDNYLPPAIVTMSTCTQNSKNEFVVKIGATLHETGFMIYYMVYQLPFSILRQAILVITCFIGVILLVVKATQAKKQQNTE